MNVCSQCGLDFATVPSFDAHRVGTHDYLYSEGIERDLPKYDGRRCLDLAELVEAGWQRDRFGRWLHPGAPRFEDRDPLLARVTLGEPAA